MFIRAPRARVCTQNARVCFYLPCRRRRESTWEAVSTSRRDILTVRYFSARDKREKRLPLLRFKERALANLIIRKSSPLPREREGKREKPCISQSEAPPYLLAYYYHYFMVYSETSVKLRHTFDFQRESLDSRVSRMLRLAVSTFSPTFTSIKNISIIVKARFFLFFFKLANF